MWLKPRPADLGRVHQEHRLRRHAHRGDLEGRESLEPATRRVALRTVRQRSRHPGRRENGDPGTAPPVVLPEAVDNSSKAPEPLIDSEWEFVTQCEALLASKAYQR
jgi:hypothetical protein